MKILVTSVENSGGGVVSQILREAGAEVIHRAVPHVHDWHAAYATATIDHVDKVVVVVRGLLANCRSMEERSGALAEWGESSVRHRQAAMTQLRFLLDSAHYDVTVVTYESMREPAEVDFLCKTLGLDPLKVTTVLEDRNRGRYKVSAW